MRKEKLKRSTITNIKKVGGLLRNVMKEVKRIRVKLPKDELPHNYYIEWWYFNGILEDKKGNKYAYMDCFVKTRNKKVKMPLFRELPFDKICYSHSLLSNIKTKKFYPRIRYLLKVSKDSFKKPLLFINYADHKNEYFNNILEEVKPFSYHIKTENFELYLDSVKKPLFEEGTGFVDLKKRKTYYYTLSNLKTKGTIIINNKPIAVRGKSWMDHQWANVRYIKDKWTWFSIQLNNNMEIVCFEYEPSNKSIKNRTKLATISYPNDKQESIHKIDFIPKAFWQSPTTKTEYPITWIIVIPEKEIRLEVKPFLKNQEMLFGTINYWEGPIIIKGKIKNKKVNGQGFLELMGYPKKVSDLKIIEMKIEKEIERDIKKIFSKSIHNILRIPYNLIKKHDR